MLKMTVVRV